MGFRSSYRSFQAVFAEADGAFQRAVDFAYQSTRPAAESASRTSSILSKCAPRHGYGHGRGERHAAVLHDAVDDGDKTP
jgi:hypothetical protein